MIVLILVALGYLAGALPTGLLVARLLEAPDPRGVGSGNIGATNLARVAGWRAGLVTLAGDGAKGALPVLLAAGLGVGVAGQAAVGAAAVVGHCWPVTLGFSGGKGVATAAGAFVVLSPLAVGLALLAYLAGLAATRTSSVGSLLACAVLVSGLLLSSAPLPVTVAGAGVVILIVVRHRDNVRRLLERREIKVRP